MPLPHMLQLDLTLKVTFICRISAFEIFASRSSVYLLTYGKHFLCDSSPLSLLACLCDPAASGEPPYLLLLTCLCAGLLLSTHPRLFYSVCVTASGGGGSPLNPSSLLATERFVAGQGEHAGDGA